MQLNADLRPGRRKQRRLLWLLDPSMLTHLVGVPTRKPRLITIDLRPRGARVRRAGAPRLHVIRYLVAAFVGVAAALTERC